MPVLELEYFNELSDEGWGLEYFQVSNPLPSCKIKLCHVKVSELQKVAETLVEDVQNTSWIHELNPTAQRAYRMTVYDTAKELIQIFTQTVETSELSKEFGELMVSVGSARALELIFNHDRLALSELWKPQQKFNEGFDFHTVCEDDLINFGEAKFGSTTTRYTDAIEQAYRFVLEEKHLRDGVHLVNLTSGEAISNLDDDHFGLIAAFSLNAQNPLTIFANALEKVRSVMDVEKVESIYLVGVSH